MESTDPGTFRALASRRMFWGMFRAQGRAPA